MALGSLPPTPYPFLQAQGTVLNEIFPLHAYFPVERYIVWCG